MAVELGDEPDTAAGALDGGPGGAGGAARAPAPGAGVDRVVARLRGFARWGDVLAVCWIAVFVVLYLSPALKDGASFGPTDIGVGLSHLTNALSPLVKHNGINGDIIDQGVPWNTLDWRAVHHGELPLWNSLSGTGLPQMFNFESAPFSLATIFGYLFPLSLSFLATIAAKLFIAGTGVYVASRVLGTGPLAGALGGTTFMLSGAFSGWLGWSVDGPVAWAGWILAGAVLAYRSRGRVRDVVLLAVSVAFSLYAGFPESYVLLAIGLGVVFVVAGAGCVLVHRRVGIVGIARIGGGVVAGGMLAAPLLLPGVSLLSGSARNGKDAATGIPLHLASLIFAQGFFGLPTKGSYWFGQVNYFETAAYVGVVAIVLALLAVLVSWRRPAVIGLAGSVVGGLLVVYQLGSGAPVQKLLSDLGLSAVALQRMQSVLEASLAILAALGCELVLRRWRELSVRAAFLGASVLVLLVVAALWTKVGSARALPTDQSPPSVATLESLRRSSLVWPTATLVLLLVLAAGMWLGHRAPERRARGTARAAGLALLGAQSAFLLFAGVGINSYFHDPYPVTPAVATLQRVVGTKLVALDSGNTDCAPKSPHRGVFCGVRLWLGTGFYPEMNIGYGVNELAMHDPMIPQAYFDAWPVANAMQVTPANLNIFVPDVDSVALARRYGASYVLALPGQKAPAGMRLVTTVAGEALYAVPGAARFSFSGSGGGRVLSSSHPGDARYVVDVDAPSSAELVARITDVIGWHAAAGRKALTIERAPGDLIRVEVPAGTHQVVFHYWPKRFTEGIVLAIAALVLLLLWALTLAHLRHRGLPRALARLARR